MTIEYMFQVTDMHEIVSQKITPERSGEARKGDSENTTDNGNVARI